MCVEWHVLECALNGICLNVCLMFVVFGCFCSSGFELLAMLPSGSTLFDGKIILLKMRKRNR